MEPSDSRTNHHNPGQDTARLWSSFGAGSSSPAQSDESMGAGSQEIGVNNPNNHIPVFLDRTFRMVEEVPDDVVCWSTAGDSFIIKQVLVLEEILPSYFNHKKFMSFVRQLNFYGFKKIKGRSRMSSRSKSTDHGDAYGDGAAAAAAAAAAGAAPTESESWEEFRHPQFRRGRRDLLVGIKRQKDSGRLKRKRADVQKSDIMSSLVTDVGTVNGELKEVKSKLDSIMSLLFNMGHAVPSNHAPQSRDNIIRDDGVAAAAAASEGGGASYGGGGDAAFFIHADPPAATAHGGYCQRFMGEASGGGGGGRAGGHGAYARGALFDYRTTPRRPVDHQQGHHLYPELSRETSAAEPYPVVPNQTRRYHVVQPQPQPLPPLGAAVAARTSESTATGPSRHQLPPLQLSPSRVSEGAASSPSSERNRSGEGEDDDNNPPKSRPPHRGDRGGGGVGGTSPSSSSCAPASGDKVVSQMQKGLSNGTMSMLQVLSESAAAETEKERANSINSSSGTQSSFEYD